MSNKIENILANVSACTICETMNGYKKFPQESHGNIKSKYMLLSEAPGKDSLSSGKYWIGAGGKILRSALIDLRKELEDIFYLTDVVKCWPNESKHNRKPLDSEVNNCFQFLIREIRCLKPELILSLGKTSSENLLNQEVILKYTHGKIFKLNESTKVLVMYHPSGIDRFMNRDIYVNQLKLVFKKLIGNNINGIEDIFRNTFNIKDSTSESLKQNKIEKPKYTPGNFKGVSFILPAVGNKITDIDIRKNQLRVTADFKRHFPSLNTNLKFNHLGESYDVRFTFRGRRSHILSLGAILMNKLNMDSNSSVKITKTNLNEFNIEKLN